MIRFLYRHPIFSSVQSRASAFIWLHLLVATIAPLLLATNVQAVVNREDIILRDPFIYTDSITNTYYMYGTVTYDGGLGFDVYTTTDPTLRTWSDPQAAFRTPGGFWGTDEFWAPEVYEYNGSYYLFGTARSVSIPHGMILLHSLTSGISP